jgi:hypothetical protein
MTLLAVGATAGASSADVGAEVSANADKARAKPKHTDVIVLIKTRSPDCFTQAHEFRNDLAFVRCGRFIKQPNCRR